MREQAALDQHHGDLGLGLCWSFGENRQFKAFYDLDGLSSRAVAAVDDKLIRKEQCLRMVTLVRACRPVVLVVEDEPLLRLHAVDLIEDAGFCVLEAPNADEAMTVLERRDDVSIVFTDVDMPGTMDGLELAAEIRNRWPFVKVIITSGKSVPNSGDLSYGVAFFPSLSIPGSFCRP